MFDLRRAGPYDQYSSNLWGGTIQETYFILFREWCREENKMAAGKGKWFYFGFLNSLSLFNSSLRVHPPSKPCLWPCLWSKADMAFGVSSLLETLVHKQLKEGFTWFSCLRYRALGTRGPTFFMHNLLIPRTPQKRKLCSIEENKRCQTSKIKTVFLLIRLCECNSGD
jgi:hypothetical protein